jgi:predicted TIM-barrel enzyme
MNTDLAERLQAALIEKTKRRWVVEVSPPVVESTMYVVVDGRIARVSIPVSINLPENDFDAAVNVITQHAADAIGALILGQTEHDGRRNQG